MIYFDNHSTTQLDPEVLAAMMPLLTWQFANPGSVTHVAGREVAERIEIALAQIANSIGGTVDELVITSGATESNNLALLGTCFHPRQKRRKVVSMTTEHRAVLDPLSRLARSGFEVVMLPVHTNEDTLAGMVDLQRLDDAVDEQTAIVSVMLANNEIGVIQPIAEIAKICHRSGALLHTDATQAVGRIVVDVDDLDVDLMSFSAHKFYGPKGVGGLFVRRRQRIVKLQSQIVGGGQQNNFRSGTLNSPGIVGMAAALQLCQKNNSLHPIAQLETNGFLHDPVACDGVEEWRRISRLTQRLYQRLSQELELVALNGPGICQDPPQKQVRRIPGNLNCSFFPVEGQSLMMAIPELAVSSGSACTSADQETSHVLRAIGLTEEVARSSLRFGLGRFNTMAEVDLAAGWIIEAAQRLQRL